MIEFRDVSKRFGDRTVLNRLSLRIGKPEILFVIGKSGTGKSVLLKHIVGLLAPDSGEILVDGEPLSRMGERELYGVRRKCGMIFQHPALLDSLTVHENVAFGVRAHRLAESEADVRSRVRETLGLVGLGDDILERYPPELSFAIQKRVSIARTLAIEPECLLFDEPTTAQDPIATRAINDLIRVLAVTLRVTCVVVSHDMHCALEIADRIVLLSDGGIVDAGTPDEMLKSRVPLTVEFLAEAKERSFLDA